MEARTQERRRRPIHERRVSICCLAPVKLVRDVLSCIACFEPCATLIRCEECGDQNRRHHRDCSDAQIGLPDDFEPLNLKATDREASNDELDSRDSHGRGVL